MPISALEADAGADWPTTAAELVESLAQQAEGDACCADEDTEAVHAKLCVCGPGLQQQRQGVSVGVHVRKWVNLGTVHDLAVRNACVLNLTTRASPCASGKEHVHAVLD